MIGESREIIAQSWYSACLIGNSMGIDSAACETITVLGVRRGGTISTRVVINPFLMGSLIMWWMCKR